MTEKSTKSSAKPGAHAATDELERLRCEATEATDRYLRAVAEFENTKKRLHREKEEFARFASETVVRDLLPIVDSLDQALVAVDPSTRPSTSSGLARDSAPQGTREEDESTPVGLRKQSDIEAIIKGVQLIHRQLFSLLEKEGVRRISSIGEPFDPHKHEAVAQVEAADGKADNTIVEEVQVGYTMHGKVIRPTIVKVAKRAEEKKGEAE